MHQVLTVGLPITLLGMGVTLVGLMGLWALVALIGRLSRPRPRREGTE